MLFRLISLACVLLLVVGWWLAFAGDCLVVGVVSLVCLIDFCCASLLLACCFVEWFLCGGCGCLVTLY